MNIERVTIQMDWIVKPDDDDSEMPTDVRIERRMYLAADSVAEVGIAVVQHGEARAALDRIVARARAGEMVFGGVEQLAVRMASRSYAFSVRNAVQAVAGIAEDIEGASYDGAIKQRVRAAADAVFDAFPWAKDVRDTYAHVEDRVLGRRRNASIANQAVDIPGSLKMAAGTRGNFVEMYGPEGFSITLGDGRHAEVPVTEAAARDLRDRVQAVIDALPWKRPDRPLPRVHPAD